MNTYFKQQAILTLSANNLTNAYWTYSTEGKYEYITILMSNNTCGEIRIEEDKTTVVLRNDENDEVIDMTYLPNDPEEVDKTILNATQEMLRMIFSNLLIA